MFLQILLSLPICFTKFFRKTYIVHSATMAEAAAAHRSKITKKVHKPPRNHNIEWPVFSDIGLNCEFLGEKGRAFIKRKKYSGCQKIQATLCSDFGEVCEPFW